MNDDELLARLREADPARRDAPADSWIDNLVEDTMSTTPEQPAQPSPAQPPRRHWAAMVASAAAVAVVAAGVAFALNRGDDAGTQQAQKTVTELSLPADDAVTGMCLQISAEALRNVDLALEGTVTEVTDDRVVLAVDRWFKGGDTDLVALVPADAGMVALIGAITFEQGARYLVSAADGVVNSCGFSGPYSAELAAVFDEAFPG